MVKSKYNNKIKYNNNNDECKCEKNEKKCKISIDYSRNNLLSQDAINILRHSYLYEGDIQDLFAIVAKKYSYDCRHAQVMYDYMSKLIFIPSTPVLRTGNDVDKHPISCFTNTLECKNIYQYLAKYQEFCAQLYEGGGSSIDLSYISNNTSDNKTRVYNGGVENYIQSLEAIHEFIRRPIPRTAIICYYLNVQHPEIQKFIEIRKPTFDLNKINVSAKTNIAVIISEKFMDKVIKDESWDLIDSEHKKVMKQISARDLWVSIIKNRYETGV
jgi:ribonucleoside-diphosphate reductase alpha chain